MSCHQIGLVIYEHSKLLAPLVDNGTIRLRAWSVPNAPDNPHFAPIQLYLYGAPHFEKPTIDACERQGMQFRWTRFLAHRAAMQAIAAQRAQSSLVLPSVASARQAGGLPQGPWSASAQAALQQRAGLTPEQQRVLLQQQQQYLLHYEAIRRQQELARQQAAALQHQRMLTSDATQVVHANKILEVHSEVVVLNLSHGGA